MWRVTRFVLYDYCIGTQLFQIVFISFLLILAHVLFPYHNVVQAYQIDTFATRVGVKKIAQGATACLLANYAQAIFTGLLAARGTFHMVPMIGGHLTLAAMLIYHYRQLNPDSMPSIKTYYKHIWDLFYLEYGLYTLI